MYSIGDMVKLSNSVENRQEFGADEFDVTRKIVSVIGHVRNPNVLIGVEPTMKDDPHFWHKASQFDQISKNASLSEIISHRDKFAVEQEKHNTIYFQGIIEGLDIAIAVLDKHGA